MIPPALIPWLGGICWAAVGFAAAYFFAAVEKRALRAEALRAQQRAAELSVELRQRDELPSAEELAVSVAAGFGAYLAARCAKPSGPVQRRQAELAARVRELEAVHSTGEVPL